MFGYVYNIYNYTYLYVLISLACGVYDRFAIILILILFVELTLAWAAFNIGRLILLSSYDSFLSYNVFVLISEDVEDDWWRLLSCKDVGVETFDDDDENDTVEIYGFDFACGVLYFGGVHNNDGDSLRIVITGFGLNFGINIGDNGSAAIKY